MAANVGTGTTITFGTTGFVAQLLDVAGSGEGVESFRTSHQGTTGMHTWLPGKITEGGRVRVQFLFDPNAAANLPTIGTVELVTITFPDADTFAAQMYIESWDWEAPFEGLMVASCEVKVADDITRTVVP